MTSRSRDPQAAATLYRTKLDLAEAIAPAEDGLVTAAVQVGGVRLRFVGDGGASDPAALALRAELERQGEGIAGLVLDLPAPLGAETLLAPLGARRHGDGLVLDPAHCHGVPLTLVPS